MKRYDIMDNMWGYLFRLIVFAYRYFETELFSLHTKTNISIEMYQVTSWCCHGKYIWQLFEKAEISVEAKKYQVGIYKW